MGARKPLFLLLVLLSTIATINGTATDPGSILETIFGEDEGEGKLSGAVSTTIDKIPYQVSIRVANTTACGGFILSPNWVMTAAHCVDGALLPAIVIRVGSSQLDSGGTTFSAISIQTHSLYNRSAGFDYDFSLVKLNGNLTFSSTVQAIAIPNQHQPIPFLGVVNIGGWGIITQQSSTYSPDLKSSNITIIPQKLCSLIYGAIVKITDRMFCAGKIALTGPRGTCQGDSGGAAVISKTAIGVASFGATCGNPIFPSVFGNIASVSAWIKGVVGI